MTNLTERVIDSAVRWIRREVLDTLEGILYKVTSTPIGLAYDSARTFFETIEEYTEEVKMQVHYPLLIICPDCGKQIAFRNRCPKCCGKSWFPAAAVPKHVLPPRLPTFIPSGAASSWPNKAC